MEVAVTVGIRLVGGTIRQNFLSTKAWAREQMWMTLAGAYHRQDSIQLASTIDRTAFSRHQLYTGQHPAGAYSTLRFSVLVLSLGNHFPVPTLGTWVLRGVPHPDTIPRAEPPIIKWGLASGGGLGSVVL